MMRFLPTLYLLLSLLPHAAVAGKESSTTKTFKFKEDVYLKFGPLPTAVGPNESADLLLASLNEGFAQQFKKVWIEEIESSLQGGGVCTVKKMRKPKFSICDWKYPDRYDVDELPMPGQCHKHENNFVQRIYYKIEELEITCPSNFDYDDLDKDGYTEEAFSGENFLDVINPPESNCDGDSNSVCLFDDADTAEWTTGYDACNAELYINRFVDIPVYLKCLNQGYGRRIANKIIDALDKYFEMEVTRAIADAVLDATPTSFVYNFASPYASDRNYCSHGAYYVDGNLVNQAPDSDGTYITKFIIGFDMIWFKDRDFDVDDLPDIEAVINEAFQDGDFLDFLENEYPRYDEFIQDSEVCQVIDPGDADVTFPPTEAPTDQPTEGPAKVTLPPTEAPTDQPTDGPLCDLDTDEGCEQGQVCRLSCVWASDEPMCFDDGTERDCRDKYGPGYICLDSDGDGVINPSDGASGCQYNAPTGSPTERPSMSPVIPIVITSTPTMTPTLRPVTSSPTISNPPSKFDWPSGSPSHSSMPSTHSPTSDPTLDPTAESTNGETDTVGPDKTLAPTPLQVRPAQSMPPTLSPVTKPTTPSPTCPQCIVHPDDTEEDECPIVTTGTCGDGDRGDGICAYEGHCCSKWGWCGTTAEHCDSSPAPAPSDNGAAPASPTYSVDAGQCAGGDVGDGFCPNESLCCSDWGYCGSGEQYCEFTRILDEETGEDYDGTCGGGGVGDGICKFGKCCSEFGFCGDTELHCTGQNYVQDDALVDKGNQIINSSPLPDNLKPEFGFRCGYTELDARSNCKPQCTHHIQCSDGEECWGIQLNYCNTFEEGEHPVCTDLDIADDDSRCGYDETSARGHCGPKCNNDGDCGLGEFCFPTLLNLCDCHESTCPEEFAIQFARAKALISPYFVESDPNNSDDSVEGKPRSASSMLGTTLVASLLMVFSLTTLFM